MELSTPDRDYSSIFDVSQTKPKKVKKIIVRKVKIIRKKKKPESSHKIVIHVKAPTPAPAPVANITKPAPPAVNVTKPKPVPEDPAKKRDIAKLDRLPFFKRMNEIGQFKDNFLNIYNGA